MTRHPSPLAWRNLAMSIALGLDTTPPTSEPAPGDEPHTPRDPDPGDLVWSCHGIDREPTDRECPECAEEARRELTCRHCGEATEPEEERCCGRSVCMAAERSERRVSE